MKDSYTFYHSLLSTEDDEHRRLTQEKFKNKKSKTKIKLQHHYKLNYSNFLST